MGSRAAVERSLQLTAAGRRWAGSRRLELRRQVQQREPGGRRLRVRPGCTRARQLRAHARVLVRRPSQVWPACTRAMQLQAHARALVRPRSRALPAHTRARQLRARVQVLVRPASQAWPAPLEPPAAVADRRLEAARSPDATRVELSERAQLLAARQPAPALLSAARRVALPMQLKAALLSAPLLLAALVALAPRTVAVLLAYSPVPAPALEGAMLPVKQARLPGPLGPATAWASPEREARWALAPRAGDSDSAQPSGPGYRSAPRARAGHRAQMPRGDTRETEVSARTSDRAWNL